MKMTFKKETKHTVVYEAADATAMVVPVESVYVSKAWLTAHNVQSKWPQAIELTVVPQREAQ